MSTQKPYSFSIDLYQPSPIPKMEFYQTDRNNCVMNIILKKQQKGLDMTGLTPYCAILKPDNTLSIYSNDVFVTDLEDGQIQVTLSMQSLGSVGLCHAQIFLTSGANTKITLPEFTFRVRKSYEEDGLFEQTNEFPIMSSVANIIANFQEKGDYDNTVKYEVYNMVRYGIGNYINTNSCTGIIPTNITNWKLVSRDGKNGFSAMQTSTFTAIANGTSHIITGFVNYDDTHDNIQVIDSYTGGELIEGINYTCNTDGASIDLIGWTVDIGYSFGFTLYSNLNGATLQSDIDNAIAQKALLEASIIEAKKSTFADEIANGRQGKTSILENFQEKDVKIANLIAEVVASRQGSASLLANLQGNDAVMAQAIATNFTTTTNLNKINTDKINIIGDPTLVDNYTPKSMTVRIEDSDSGLKYVGAFVAVTSPIYPYLTSHVSTSVNDVVNFTFTGSAIKLYDITTPNSGIIEIFIDGISKGKIDRYSTAITTGQKAYEVANLVYGEHLFKIVNTETKNVNSTGYAFALDYLEIITNSSILRDVSLEVTNSVKQGDIYLNVKDFGAKGDGVTDDTLAIQDCINHATNTSTIFFPSTGLHFYNVSSLTIPTTTSDLRLLGSGMVHSWIKFTSNVAVSILTNGCHFSNMRLTGTGFSTSGSTIFKDNRTLNTADFDFSMDNCYISDAETVVDVKGRGVSIDSSFFYNIRYQIIKADFPAVSVFVAGAETTQKFATGFRGFVFRNSGVHYSPCSIITNLGANAKNMVGILITGNKLEGSVSYFEGYARNMTISNNIHYHVGNTREALIMLHGCDNVNIDVNVSGMKVEVDGVNSYCNKLVHCSGFYNNLTIKANIQDTWKDVFCFTAGGNNLDIQVNAGRICQNRDADYNLVRLLTPSAIYDGVNVRGSTTSPFNHFMGIQRDSNQVNNYNVNLDIIGDFYMYDNLNSLSAGVRRTLTGIYGGDGKATQYVQVKYKPALVQIMAVGYVGIKPVGTSVISGEITITDGGFVITGIANTLNKIYAYTVM